MILNAYVCFFAHTTILAISSACLWHMLDSRLPIFEVCVKVTPAIVTGDLSATAWDGVDVGVLD